MFTGIIEEVGRVAGIGPDGAGSLLRVDVGALAEGVALGDSIAINGVCLTVDTIESDALVFRATRETLDLTSLGRLRPGSRVNLERAMQLGGRLGGHLVTGHVDGLGHVREIRKQAGDWRFHFEVPGELAWGLVHKGSICVDGISLTVVEPRGPMFSVAIVQFTLDHTVLGDLSVGDPVNIEVDVMGRWVAHLHRAYANGTPPDSAGLDEDRLRALGWLDAGGPHEPPGH